MHLFGIRHRGNVQQFEFTISADTQNWDLLDEIGFLPTGAVEITILVEAGVVVTSSNISIAAMNLDGLREGSRISLTNLGFIQGKGGGAGAGGGNGFFPGFPGQVGGPGIFGPGENVELTIVNASGEIAGGGGGGGGGGSGEEWLPVPLEPGNAGGGGGGGGAGGGVGGAGGPTTGVGGSDTDGADGTAGTTGAAAAAGDGGDGGVLASGGGAATGGDGGDGGELGDPGTNGAPGLGHSNGNALGGAGGAAGAAINANDGDIIFTSGGSAPNVLGAIINEG